jgi:hypothetical protein
VPAAASSQALAAAGAKLPARLRQSKRAAFYVDGDKGRDTNRGTRSRPWQTIVRAWRSVPPGSLITVRAGTYATPTLLVDRAASASAPITLRAQPGEVVTLRGTKEDAAVYIANVTGLRLVGFRVTNPAGDGIKVTNSTDVEIQANTVTGNGNQGILVVGCCSGSRTYSSNIQLWSNTIYGNGANGQTAYNHGVYYGAADTYADGRRRGTLGGVIANNVFFDQPTGYHLQIGPQADGLVVTNNTFSAATASYPSGNAIQLWSTLGRYVTKNITVVNNAITFNNNMGVHGSGSAMPNNVVRNNLGYANANGDFVARSGSTVLFSTGSGNISGQDPRFVDRAAKNFRPRSDSPLVGRADPAYAPPLDRSGARRRGRPDLGAYQHAVLDVGTRGG